MFNKGNRGLFAKKAYSNRAPPGLLFNTELEAMQDSSAFQEATIAKVEDGKKAFEDEVRKLMEKQAKLEAELMLKERQLQESLKAKQVAAEEEEKKKKPIQMDLDNVPSDRILLPPQYEEAKKQRTIVSQLSTPINSKQKLYYTQVLTKEIKTPQP